MSGPTVWDEGSGTRTGGSAEAPGAGDAPPPAPQDAADNGTRGGSPVTSAEAAGVVMTVTEDSDVGGRAPSDHRQRARTGREHAEAPSRWGALARRS